MLLVTPELAYNERNVLHPRGESLDVTAGESSFFTNHHGQPPETAMAASFQFRLSHLLLAGAGWAVFLSVAKTLGAAGCFWLFLILFVVAKALPDRALRRSCMLVCAGGASMSLSLACNGFSLFFIVGMLVGSAGALALLGSLRDRRLIGCEASEDENKTTVIPADPAQCELPRDGADRGVVIVP